MKRTRHFSLDDCFPEAASIFTSRPKSIDAIKEKCSVVLDTNVLLAPYRLDATSLNEIKPIYESLVKDRRLKVPGRVAREYARIRPKQLSEIVKLLRDYGSQTKNPFQKRIAFLETDEDYRKLMAIGKTIETQATEVQKLIAKLVERMHDWTTGDPVLTMYQSMLSSCVFDLEQTDEERSNFSKELSSRNELKIPPGYQDANKNDDGAGDLLIWHTILRIGAFAEGSDLLFVSGEEKNDWWIRNQSVFQPRPELVEEYRLHSKGGTFHIVDFPTFLRLFKASENLIAASVEAEERAKRGAFFAQKEERLNYVRALRGDVIRSLVRLQESALDTTDANVAADLEKTRLSLSDHLESLSAELASLEASAKSKD